MPARQVKCAGCPHTLLTRTPFNSLESNDAQPSLVATVLPGFGAGCDD
jgi:hypothetical protein